MIALHWSFFYCKSLLNCYKVVFWILIALTALYISFSSCMIDGWSFFIYDRILSIYFYVD
jgi:hypothetical protein